MAETQCMTCGADWSSGSFTPDCAECGGGALAATLSFLGVGVRPPVAEWGAMVNEGRNVLVTGWWVSLFPSVMIVLFVLAVNLVGDVLRDRLDPALRSGSAVSMGGS